MRHIIAILLQNEAGSLARVAGLFSTRAYNIESLSVAPTDNPAVSRLTLVTTGDDAVLAQIASQLRKLIDVVGVEDLTGDSHIERELLLVKLRVTPQSLEGLSRVIQSQAHAFCPGYCRISWSKSPVMRRKPRASSPKYLSLVKFLRSYAAGRSAFAKGARRNNERRKVPC